MSMPTLPNRVYLKWSDILNSDCGITKNDLRAAIEAGALERVVFPGKTRAKYRRADVMRVFGLKGGEHDA